MMIAFAFAIPNRCWAKEPSEFDTLTKKFESLMLQHQVKHDAAKKSLDKGYKKHLESLQKKFAADSDLESAVNMRNELSPLFRIGDYYRRRSRRRARDSSDRPTEVSERARQSRDQFGS